MPLATEGVHRLGSQESPAGKPPRKDGGSLVTELLEVELGIARSPLCVFGMP